MNDDGPSSKRYNRDTGDDGMFMFSLNQLFSSIFMNYSSCPFRTNRRQTFDSCPGCGCHYWKGRRIHASVEDGQQL